MYYTNSYQITSADAAGILAGLGAFLIVIWIIVIAVCVLYIIGLWKVFKKAGEEGWKAIIPFYNNWILFKIAGLEPALSLLMLIPLATLPMTIVVMINLAKAFNKSGGFTAGLILLSPIFMLILGTGDAKYVGAQSGSQAAPAAPATPAAPTAPAPAAPATQEAPTPAPAPAPEQPTAPAAPAAPVAPAPEQPVAPVEPTTPEQPQM